MSFSPEYIVHYAMLLRLVMLMAISGFGILVVILVPIMRLWLAHLTVTQPPGAGGWTSGRQAHERVGVAVRDLGSV
jgi:hypothetical protein